MVSVTDCRNIAEEVVKRSETGLAKKELSQVHIGNDGVKESAKPKHSRLVGWLTAAQNKPFVLDQGSEVFECDVKAFFLRVSMLVFYAGMQVAVCTVGMVYFYVVSKDNPPHRMLVCGIHAGCVLLVLGSMHIINSFRWMTQMHTLSLCCALLVLLNLLGAPPFLAVLTCLKGWHWSGGTMLAMSTSCIAGVYLTDRTVPVGSVLMAGMAVAMVSIMVYFAGRPELSDVNQHDRGIPQYWGNSIAILVPYGLVPLCAACLFRVSPLLVSAKPATHSRRPCPRNPGAHGDNGHCLAG